jgi:hypothetical protein
MAGLVNPDSNEDSDHQAFVARLEEISAKCGSRAALAKAAEMAPTSLQAYFQNSEPTRPVLNRLALAGEVSTTWLASGHGSRSPHGLPDGNFAIPFIDFCASAGRIYPLLGDPTDHRVFRISDFEQSADQDLLAVRMPESFEPYITKTDTLVINRNDQPSIRNSRSPTPGLPLQKDAVYVVAREARLMLRQLRWNKVGESLIVLIPGSTRREIIVDQRRVDFQVIGRIVWRGGSA